MNDNENLSSRKSNRVAARGQACPAELERQQDKKRAAKLFHRKSRTGCKQCRTRRVKCNESKPICFACYRLNLVCVYDRVATDSHKAPAEHRQQRDQDQDSKKASTVAEEAGLPESERRRKLEILLFQRYLMDTVPTISLDQMAAQFYGEQLPRMALKSDALLYSVYFLSALDLAKRGDKNNVYGSGQSKETSNFDFMALSQTYFSMALREHTREVSQLSESNADIACMTTSMLRIYYFTILSTRVVEPYTPPTDWLRTMAASHAIFKLAWPFVEKIPESPMFKLMAQAATITSRNRTEAAYIGDFAHLLRREEPHELSESWDQEIEQAYSSTLSDIEQTWSLLRSGHPVSDLRRRIAIFPIFVPWRFVDMVEEARPRALIILAHFFALVAMFREVWWIGNAGVREVQAILRVVPQEWMWMMSWPLQMLDRDPIPEAAFVRNATQSTGAGTPSSCNSAMTI